jgi:hypothetical protein
MYIRKIRLNIKYTTIHAIQKYGPVAQPGRVPDFYHIGRNPAVSGSNPDGPVIKLVLKRDSRIVKIEKMSKRTIRIETNSGTQWHLEYT